jgi:hypothetical protein
MQTPINQRTSTQIDEKMYKYPPTPLKHTTTSPIGYPPLLSIVPYQNKNACLAAALLGLLFWGAKKKRKNEK